MVKLDLRKELKALYHATAKKMAVVDVPEMSFLMVDGCGDPNHSERFQEGVEALFALSYTLKFMVKKGRAAIDYKVMPLEGLWWMDGGACFDLEKKDRWQWTLMIMQPDLVTPILFEEAFQEVQDKKGFAILPDVRLASFCEGLCAQALHIGPYSAEGATIRRLHGYISEQGYEPRGIHHEIYLGDPRRATPERLKTIIRQPVQQS